MARGVVWWADRALRASDESMGARKFQPGHCVTPSWMMVNVTDGRPITCALIAPRRMASALADTKYVIVPVVMPEEPAVISIHGTSAAAVHWQAAVVVI